MVYLRLCGQSRAGLFSKTVFRKMSSRASQIGAALLFDLGTVDRRLVGPDDKANDRHGVFRVK
jgi:hypothetical protein